jgi:hypothetical protein
MDYNNPNQPHHAILAHRLCHIPTTTPNSQSAFNNYSHSNNTHHSYPLSSRTSQTDITRCNSPPPPHYLQIRSYLFQQDSLPRLINNSLIPVAVVPLLTVGKKPVDDDTADGEDEDEDGPQELVADGAAGLEDLD